MDGIAAGLPIARMPGVYSYTKHYRRRVMGKGALDRIFQLFPFRTARPVNEMGGAAAIRSAKAHRGQGGARQVRQQPGPQMLPGAGRGPDLPGADPRPQIVQRPARARLAAQVVGHAGGHPSRPPGAAHIDVPAPGIALGFQAARGEQPAGR